MEGTNKLILAFIALIIGAVLISQIATLGLAVTAKTDVVNELVGITSLRNYNGNHINETVGDNVIVNVPTSWKITDCPITNFVYGNATKDYTLTIDYTFDSVTGVIHLYDKSPANISISNSTYADYTYCQDSYLNSGWSRSVLDLVVGFFAIAMLLVSVGLFYSIAKDNGILK